MRLKTLVFPIILLALAACGGEDEIELQKGPFLLNDRNELLFDTEFGSGTYLGASTFNALLLENRGDAPLEITKVEKSGSGAFVVELPAELEEGLTLKLESRKTALIQVKFTPTQARDYEGKLTITSNAGNSPTKEIRLFGKGVTPP
ncbi:MAG TPA: hypothetical protein VNA24_29605 [Hyalangium sp.]|jgi:hypothetical protein|nr:hypothetical protein [Hyalangium sp.]